MVSVTPGTVIKFTITEFADTHQEHTQLTFTFSKSKIKTLEKSVKYFQS